MFDYTCGSIDVQVITGSLDVEFLAENGGTATATLNENNGLQFDESTFVITAPESNTETVTVVINGEQVPFAPGETVDGDLIAAGPLAAIAPHDITKDRYLSLNPSNNIGLVTALRVTRVGSATPWYVRCTLQDAGIDGKLSELVPTAEFCEWTDTVIHVRGCEIVPGNEYLVEATADDATFSSPLSVLTTSPQISASRQFGDVVGSLVAGAWTAPDGLVTVNDITAVVQKFQLLGSAPHLSRIDNDGKSPNGIIASNDILRAVIAFAGGDFGFGVTDCLAGTCVPNCP